MTVKRFLSAAERVLLYAAAVLLPFSINLTLDCLALLGLNTLALCAVSRHIGNPALPRAGRYTLWGFVAFIGIYLLSLSYTANTSAGIANVTVKASLLLAVLFFGCADLRWFTFKQLRQLLYGFTLALAIRFAWHAVALVIRQAGGAPHDELFGFYFDPMHHSYLSMYLLLALAFLYLELRRPAAKRMLRWCQVTAVVICVAYILVLQSRACFICLVGLGAWMLYEIVVRDRRFKLGLLIIALIVAGGIGISLAVPQSMLRISSTIAHLIDGNSNEDRFGLTHSALLVTRNHLPWGCGAGDRIDAMTEQYAQLYSDPLKHQLNPHNQYLDTLMATGIHGLIILLALIGIALTHAARLLRHARKDCPQLHPARQLLMSMLLVFALNLCFESMLERQMALLFLGLFLPLLQIAASPNPSDNPITQ